MVDVINFINFPLQNAQIWYSEDVDCGILGIKRGRGASFYASSVGGVFILRTKCERGVSFCASSVRVVPHVEHQVYQEGLILTPAQTHHSFLYGNTNFDYFLAPRKVLPDSMREVPKFAPSVLPLTLARKLLSKAAIGLKVSTGVGGIGRRPLNPAAVPKETARGGLRSLVRRTPGLSEGQALRKELWL